MTENPIAQRLARHAYYEFMRQNVYGDEGGESCWILVDNEDDGMDVAYHLTKEYVKDYAETTDPDIEVPHDTLPIRPSVNPDNGRDTWVISQPNHIATAEVTMQDVAAMGDYKTLAEEEREAAEVLGADDLQSKYKIDATNKEPKNRSLGMLLVDQEWPMWGEVNEFIGEDTEIQTTDRVKLERDPEAAPSKNRYEADTGSDSTE